MCIAAVNCVDSNAAFCGLWLIGYFTKLFKTIRTKFSQANPYSSRHPSHAASTILRTASIHSCNRVPSSSKQNSIVVSNGYRVKSTISMTFVFNCQLFPVCRFQKSIHASRVWLSCSADGREAVTAVISVAEVWHALHMHWNFCAPYFSEGTTGSLVKRLYLVNIKVSLII